MTRPRRGSGEEGTSLILALAFLMVFAILIPAILDLGTTNVQATSRLQSQRATTYTADGAMDGAIQYLRNNESCGRPAPLPACPSFVWVDDDGVTATVTYQNTSTNPLLLDREVQLVSAIDGVNRVEALVVIKDGDRTTTPGNQPVEVKSWRYNR